MTDQVKRPRPRYDEGCLAAHALNVIGDRWALLVVRELMFAPKRFQMIRAGLPGVTASVLTGRLAQLVQAGTIDHDDRLGIYALTDLGRGLLPVLEALCQWALTMPGHDPKRFISPSALMISMGVNLQRDLIAGKTFVAGFDLGTESFDMRLADGVLRTTAARPPDTPFLLRGTGNTLAIAVYGAHPLSDLMSQGVVTAEGDVDSATEFLSLFRLAPQP
ncbi:transcriptional regulator, HxlR family [Ruegeria sp. TrichCH4B]|nr:transcriptional regulator, HxlR family [Ruegeria sp. TrichCH4B]